jgi:hypothetical protein
VTTDTIYLDRTRGTAPPEFYSATNVQSIERSIRATHRYGKGGVLGALFGTAVGYGVYRVTRGPTSPQGAFKCTNVENQLTCIETKKPGPNLTVPIGATLGLVGGLAIARKTTSHKWEVIQFTALR